MRGVGIAALAAAFVSAAAFGLQRIGLHYPSSSSTADAFAFINAHSGRLIIASFIQAFSLLLFAIPLIYLFDAANLRSGRPRPWVRALLILGPVALGIAAILVAFGGRDQSQK